jgi:hypothetical protein
MEELQRDLAPVPGVIGEPYRALTAASDSLQKAIGTDAGQWIGSEGLTVGRTPALRRSIRHDLCVSGEQRFDRLLEASVTPAQPLQECWPFLRPEPARLQVEALHFLVSCGFHGKRSQAGKDAATQSTSIDLP